MEVLEFVARYGVVPRDAVAVWADTAETMTQRRERRLRLGGLVKVEHPFQGSGPFLTATRAGLGLCLRGELPLAHLSLAKLQHHAVCARLGARLERAGECLLSERELYAQERASGKRDFSIRLRERLHRPDLVRLGDPPTAIEVELTRKAQGRLEEIIRVWSEEVIAGRFERVVYYCSAEVLPYVERAVEQARADQQIGTELLPDEDFVAPLLLADLRL